MDEIKS